MPNVLIFDTQCFVLVNSSNYSGSVGKIQLINI